MAGQWKVFVDDRPWDASRRLFIRWNEYRGSGSFVAPMQRATAEPGALYDTPTLSETREDHEDNLGDVTGFLQAALDAAWSLGMRPAGFADHTNELAAIRAHLDDMRRLAKIPPKAD